MDPAPSSSACAIFPHSTDAANARSLPGSPGVFFLSDAAGQPVLLASGQNIRRAVIHRLAPPAPDESSRRADLRAVVRTIQWIPAYSRFETDLRYWRAARALYPRDYRDRLAFGPAWFLRADASESAPRFVPVSRYQDAGPLYLGPFATRRHAEQYVQMLEDLFDLCRYYHVLQQAPHGQACAYFEMGRCPAPCDGTVPMDQYRATFESAARFAVGADRSRLNDVDRMMRDAAAALQFERAASLRTTLERARSTIDDPSMRFVRDLGHFRWLCVQAAGPRRRPASRSAVRAFFVDRGAIDESQPATIGELEQALPEWQRRAAQPASDPIASDDEIIWLVTRYLFHGRPRAGLFFCGDDLPASEALAGEIRSHFSSHERPTDPDEPAGEPS